MSPPFEPISAFADDARLVIAADELRALGPLVRVFDIEKYRTSQGVAGAAGAGICGYIAYASDAAATIVGALALFITVEVVLVFGPRRWRGVRVHEEGLVVAAALTTRTYRWPDIVCATVTSSTGRGARLELAVADGGRLRFFADELAELDALADLLRAHVDVDVLTA